MSTILNFVFSRLQATESCVFESGMQKERCRDNVVISTKITMINSSRASMKTIGTKRGISQWPVLSLKKLHLNKMRTFLLQK